MALFTVGSLNIEAAVAPPPPKGWACSALSAPTVIILNFIILNIFITPVKLIYKKYKTLTKKESLIR